MDLLLSFNQDIFAFDLTTIFNNTSGDLQGDEGLLTAVIISLFTDARANADDPLPDERIGQASDLRGFWGDLLPEGAKSIGSRLWLLSREKELPEVVARAQQYAEEALRWLLQESHVSALNIKAFGLGNGHLGIDVQALYADGAETPNQEWHFVYDYKNASSVRISAPGF